MKVLKNPATLIGIAAVAGIAFGLLVGEWAGNLQFIGTMFIRSYEQGERVYISMLCRGYGRDSFLFVKKKPLGRGDMTFLCTSMAVIVVIPVTIWLTPFRIF